MVINKLQVLTAAHCVKRYQFECETMIVTNLDKIPRSKHHPKDLGHPWYKAETIKFHDNLLVKDRQSNIAIITIKPGEEYNDMARINPPILESEEKQSKLFRH